MHYHVFTEHFRSPNKIAGIGQIHSVLGSTNRQCCFLEVMPDFNHASNVHVRKHGRLRIVNCFTTTKVFLQLYLINTTHQMFKGSNIFLILKSDYIYKYLYNVTKYSNKSCSFELSIHQRVLKHFPNILSSTTVFNIDTNNKCLLNSKSAY